MTLLPDDERQLHERIDHIQRRASVLCLVTETDQFRATLAALRTDILKTVLALNEAEERARAERTPA